MADLWMYRRFASWDEFAKLAASLFGNDWKLWTFACPSCESVSTGEQFEELGADPESASRECIGRYMPKNDDGSPERGCDWTAYGLYSGPWFVQSCGGVETGVFPLAEHSQVDPVMAGENS
jgi:hypothetical protein